MAAVARMSLAWRSAFTQSVNEKKGVADHEGAANLAFFEGDGLAFLFSKSSPDHPSDQPVTGCQAYATFAFAIAKIRQ